MTSGSLWNDYRDKINYDQNGNDNNNNNNNNNNNKIGIKGFIPTLAVANVRLP